ncbi:ABC transporter permease [Chryseolinea lacunae]|uniref:ABC transporter permease n=1 Tax=Chryseolinea lacunae TaxID=2801331 RepID=A0ABS1L0Q2_9BACT|nr:ABC transporter permease [Chryseolinea lacunae]MBL0745271.1 ABC transporter permease [Chryseolinea lacunae]
MIKNYLVIALRNFLRNKNYTIINVLGLTIGITSCVVIFLLITYDLGFDKFHSKYDNIYRVVQGAKSASGTEYSSTTPYPLAPALRNDFPEIPLVTQLHYQDEMLVRIGDEKQMVDNIIFADSLFFQVFDFKVLSGRPEVDLGQPGKVFLTESLAKKLLKDDNITTLKFGKDQSLEIAGIIADPPAASHVNFSMVVSMPSLNSDLLGGLPLDQWGMTASGYVYIVLPSNITAASMTPRFKGFVDKYFDKEDATRKWFSLQPLREIHFSKDYVENPGPSANAEYSDLVVMGVLGLFILIIACINFINLSTALAIRKSKEIGIRKTLGAKRGQLTLYFLGETLLITLVAVLISLCATEWLLPWLNTFLSKALVLNLFSNGLLALFLVGLIFIATFFSGFYPAVILSGFDPAAVLKNKISAQGSSGATVRKVLVIFQFMIAQVLIIGTLVVADQMEYFRSKPLGFSKDAIIDIPIPDITKENLQSLRARLEAIPNIEHVSFTLGPPTSSNNFNTGFQLSEKGSDESFRITVKPVDVHYMEVYGIKLKAGRWFTEAEERQADSDLPKEERVFKYILNESAVRTLGFHDPQEILGKMITTGVRRISAEVIGVVEDFHSASLHEAIQPVVLMHMPDFYYVAGLKVKPENFSETIRAIEKNWTEVFPNYFFSYEFLDQELAALYRQDERTFTLFKIFAGISIFIGCLGLYGLISFMANQKMKEVGIRKVMGASTGSILMLFSKEFIKLIVIAFVMAAPLAWYFMHTWLEGFAYRVDIQWTVFLIGVISTMVIALATVSYRSLRAAVSNPAETLRTE